MQVAAGQDEDRGVSSQGCFWQLTLALANYVRNCWFWCCILQSLFLQARENNWALTYREGRTTVTYDL
jgi:hypothetical protein